MSDKSTQPRLDATKVSPELYKAMLGLEKYVEGSGLEQKLLDLVKIRASQIIVMHTNDARKHGESDESMHLLNAWHEAPIYSARERAALAWTEAVQRSATITYRTRCTTRRVTIFLKRNLSISPPR